MKNQNQKTKEVTKTISEKDKEKVNKEVLDILMFHLKVLQMEPSKENVKLATTMFVEGVKYWKEKKEIDISEIKVYPKHKGDKKKARIVEKWLNYEWKGYKDIINQFIFGRIHRKWRSLS